jgi:hypothetical protein
VPTPPPRRATQVPRFRRAKRDLSEDAQKALDSEVQTILVNPLKGEQKAGPLRDVRVVKFTVSQQHYLAAYLFLPKSNVVQFLDVGSHENFYRDLRRYLGNR